MQKKRIGFTLQWHVTNACDQRCKHCYIYNSENKPVANQEISLDVSKKVVDDFISFCRWIGRPPFFVVTGGDPLLYSKIWEVLAYLKSRNVRFSILGNPFHLNSAVCQRLHELGCASYQMSIDGMEETHDMFRKDGSFAATIGAIPLLREAKIKTMIMTTVSRENFQEIGDVIQATTAAGANTYTFARYCPTHGDTEDNLTSGEYRDFLSNIWQQIKSQGMQGTRFLYKDHLWKAFLIEEGVIKPPKNNHEKVADGCHCASDHLTLLPDGSIYACRRFESNVGNIFDKNLYSVWHGKEMRNYRRVADIEGCRDCELLYFCRGCRAVAHGTTGNFFAKDPQCWR